MMSATGKSEDPPKGPTHELVSVDELARLRGIEDAAKKVVNQMQGRRSASPMLAAIAALRAALKEQAAPSADESG
jgi:hypothetical protein